jgi:DNA polymerase (family 10)
LRRSGYQYDVPTIIEACKANNVVIELNADPWRLDIDWRWVWQAQEAGVMISINPDAHHTNRLKNMRYGVLSGRKGGLLRSMTFNALSLAEIEAWLGNKKLIAK